MFGITAVAGTYNARNLPVSLYCNDATQRSYVCNPDSLLSDNAVTEINKLCRQVEESTGAHLLTVMVERVEGGDLYGFAKGLFEKHHVGNTQSTGLIMVIATKDRKWQISTGQGMEKYITDAAAAMLGRHTITPKMQQEDNDGAALAAIKDISTILLGNKELAEQYQNEADSLSHNAEDEQEWWTIGVFVAACLALILILIFCPFRTIMFIIALPFLILFWPIELVWYKLRRRKCSKCGTYSAKYSSKVKRKNCTSYIYYCTHCGKKVTISRHPFFDAGWYTENTGGHSGGRDDNNSPSTNGSSGHAGTSRSGNGTGSGTYGGGGAGGKW